MVSIQFLNEDKFNSKKETILDSRFACFTHFEKDRFSINNLHIISSPNGYLFCIPIHDNRISVGCVASKSSFNASPNFEEMLSSSIENAPFVKELTHKAKRVLPVIPIKNIQSVCEKPAEKRYRLIGDAAIFMDPFFCPGIDFALSSAEQAILSLQEKNHNLYHAFVQDWLKNNLGNIYSTLESSNWNHIIRLFADPHLPYLVSIMLTQTFCQITQEPHRFKNGVDIARNSYAHEIY